MSAQTAKMLKWLPVVRRPRFTYSIGLQVRIAFLVASGLLALIAIFVVLGLSALRASSDREIQQKSLMAQMAAGHLDALLSEATGSANWAAAGLAAPLQAGDLTLVRSVLHADSRRARPDTSALLLFDAAGRRLQTEPSSLSFSYPALSLAVRSALDSNKASTIDWVRGGTSGFALVIVPVKGSDGRNLGSVAAAVDFSEPSLKHWLQQISMGQNGMVDVVDSTGIVLAASSDEGRLGPSDHASYFSNLMAQKRPAVDTCYDCHGVSGNAPREKEIMAFAPLQDANWGVVLREPENEVLGPTRVLQQQVLGLGLISLVVALFMVWLTTRSVLSPIRALTASARRIAEGELDEDVAAQGTDEIAELGRTLDFMRLKLQRSMDEIKGCNTELNRRVLERTAELERSRDELEQSRDSMQLLIDRLSTLNAIAVALNRSLELEKVLQEALANALRLTSMDAGAIYLVDEQTGELELAAHKGISGEAARVAANFGLSATLCAAAAQTGEPLVMENTGRYARGTKSILVTEKMHCMARVPFKSDGRLLGTMVLGCPESRSFSKAEMELLTSVANQIAVAVQKVRLYEELQRKEKLRGDLLQRVISAQEEERKRIARELHDETSQALAALAVAVETAAAQASDGGDVGSSLDRMKSLAVSTLEEVHRLVFDLRPTLLDDLGLIAALRWYAETRLGEVGIKVRVEIGGEDRRLGPLIETTLYRVIQEAVNNVANHSGAQNFTITLVMKTRCLSLTMVDDGWGFDMAELARSNDGKRGLGLMGMKERVELLGGTFSIYSELGHGTEITMQVPLEGEGSCDG